MKRGIKIYRNRKHRGLYLFQGLRMDRTNGQKPRVMADYQSLFDGVEHTRQMDEFNEKFEELTDAEMVATFASVEVKAQYAGASVDG